MVSMFSAFLLTVVCLLAAVALAGIIAYIIKDEAGFPIALITFIVLIVLFVTGVFESVNEPNVYLETRYELYAIADNTNTEGSFFLGSGRISEEGVYDFYYTTTDGGYKWGSVTANDRVTTIYPTDGEPYIEIFKEKDSGRILLFDWEDEYGTMVMINIYIPTGSVTNEYHLDLE